MLKNGFYGDSAYTFEVGDVAPEIQKLLSSYKGMPLTLAIGAGSYGEAHWRYWCSSSNTCRSKWLRCCKRTGRTRIGKELHEAPEVPNYGRRGNGPRLVDGMVLAIEPMINLGTREVLTDEDGWTIVTKDRLVSAHFEHDIVVRKVKADVLSSFDEIEKVINKTK